MKFSPKGFYMHTKTGEVDTGIVWEKAYKTGMLTEADTEKLVRVIRHPVNRHQWVKISGKKILKEDEKEFFLHVRIGYELHKHIREIALRHKMSVSDLVKDCLARIIHEDRERRVIALQEVLPAEAEI